jgi:hypothetical protein
MDNRKLTIILITLISSLLLIILLLSYMNSIDGSKHEWLLNIKPFLNVISIILLIMGIIIVCIFYLYFVLNIEDLKKQCFVNMCVFFSCIFIIVILTIVQNYLNLSIDKTDGIWISTFKIFLGTLFGVVIGGSICLILAVFIASFFWCFQCRFETIFGRSNARESQTNTNV